MSYVVTACIAYVIGCACGFLAAPKPPENPWDE